MSITSYAQNFEDVMLWRALAHIEKGFYIDIGAQDPLVDSVSLAFHQHGWRGIHVEPTDHYAALLRLQRPGDTVIQAAVANATGVMQFYEIPFTGISTADPLIAQQHRDRGFAVLEISVPCVPLATVFDECSGQEIHWLKIDVEGLEGQVLSSWGESTARPWVVVVESTLPLTQIESHSIWEGTLIGYGYSPVFFDGLNRYYVSDAHQELKAAFLSPPNVFDGFVLNGTASSSFHKLIVQRHRAEIDTIQAEVQRREETMSDQLRVEREKLAEMQRSAVQRDLVISEQRELFDQMLIALSRESAERERESASRALAAQESQSRQLGEMVSAQRQLVEALNAKHAEMVSALCQELKSVTDKNLRLAQEHQTHQRLYVGRINQVQGELQSLLKVLAKREREFSSELMAFRRQSMEELDRRVRLMDEQAKAQQEHHANLERRLVEEVSELRLLVQQQRSTQELLISQHSDELRRQDATARQVSEASAVIEATLREEIEARKQVERQLRHSLDEETRQWSDSSASIFWRLAARLRSPRVVTSAKSEPPLLRPPSAEVMAVLDIPKVPSTVSAFIDSDSTNNMTTLNSSSKVAAAASLEELLAQHDQQFVHSAYQTVLGRAPDHAGLVHYVGRLRAGVSRTQVLAELHLSKEGAGRTVNLPGLEKELRRNKRARLPLVGWIYRLRYGIESDSTVARRLRAIENLVFRLSEDNSRRFDRVEDSLIRIQSLLAGSPRRPSATGGLTSEVPSGLENSSSAILAPQEDVQGLPVSVRQIYYGLKDAVERRGKGN